MIEALESRKFTSTITRTQRLSLKWLKNIQKQPEYVPEIKNQLAWFHPEFIRIHQDTLRTQIRYLLHLKEAANTAFYQKGQGVVAKIIQGVKGGQIQPYKYTPARKQLLRHKLNTKALLEKLMFYDETSMDTLTIPLSELYQIELMGHLDVNTATKKSAFKITYLALLIPKDVYPAYFSGPTYWAIFDFNELKRYLDLRFHKSQAEESNDCVWINPHDLSDKKSFAEAFEKQLYKGEISWFLNKKDDDLYTLWRDYLQHTTPNGNAVKVSFSQAQYYVRNYLTKFTGK